MSLHKRIANQLGWTLQDARSHTLQALRELVRPENPRLADEITFCIERGVCLIRGPGKKKSPELK